MSASRCSDLASHRRRPRTLTLLHDLGLGQESLNGQQLVSCNVHLVLRLEAARLHSRVHLDGEVDLVDRAEDLVDLADL